MRARLFTMPFSATLGGFDDSGLVAFTRDKELLAFREHFFVANEIPHLVCVVTWQDPAIRRDDLDGARELGDRKPDRGIRPTPPERSGRSRPDPAAELDERSRVLFNTLRQWRLEKSKEEGVPAYLIFTNRHLIEIITRRPGSANALGQIPGIGPGKIKRYGEEVLGLLQGCGKSVPGINEPEPENKDSAEVSG